MSDDILPAASAELFRRAFYAVPYALAVVRADDALILEVNRRWEQLFGYSRDEAVGRRPLDLILYLDPADRDRLRETLRVDGSLKDFEIALRTRAGDVRHALVSSEPVDVDGLPCLLTSFRDITERKAAGEALRETEARNRAILNAVPDLMFLQTLDGVYVDYHAKDVGQLLVAPSEFLGRNMRDVLPPHLSDGLFAAFRKVRATGGPVVFEYGLEIGGGHRFYESRVVLLDDDKVLSIVRDITERQCAEEAIRASNERIKDLAGRLIVAQEDERRRISRDLHDDLNQRIAALTISISNRKRRLPDSREEIVDRLSELQLGAVDLAENVRVLSHQLHSAVLEHAGLESALRATCDEFASHTGIAVDFSAEGDAEPVPRDVALCVYRVVQEALRNVEKHAAASRASVLLRCEGRDVSALVADEGGGFDYDEAKRRNGLGLVSMEERVRLLHGTLEVDTAPGRGTRLRARIPF